MHQQHTRQHIGKLLTAALALSMTGCGLAFVPIRIPTRPDGVDTQIVLATDEPVISADCVALTAPRTVDHLDMFTQLNTYRVEHGLNTLQYSETLERASDQYALRMAQEDFFAHTAPDGSEPSDRAEAAGFCDRFVGENLAWGLNSMRSAREAMQGFMDSPGHNENMLREHWDFVGIGYVARPTIQGTEYYWVQLYGTDRSAR